MGKTKHLGIPIDPELYRKLTSLAEFNGNSVNKEVIRIMNKALLEWEAQNKKTDQLHGTYLPVDKVAGVMRGLTLTYSDAVSLRLTQLCAEKKITINKLATLSGLTQSTVEDIMSGRTKNPTLKTLHRIAIGLNLTVAELLNFPEMNETLFDDE